jgi:hypothetical protein
MQVFGSVQRFVLDVAVLGIALGIIFLFPGPSLTIAITVGLFVPTAIACAFCACLCDNRQVALAICVIGAMIGRLLAPDIEAIHELPTRYDWYLDNLNAWAILPPAGAAVAGAIVWSVELAARFRKRQTGIASKRQQDG